MTKPVLQTPTFYDCRVTAPTLEEKRKKEAGQEEGETLFLPLKVKSETRSKSQELQLP